MTAGGQAADAFAFLVDDLGFVADAPVIDDVWMSAQLTYRRDGRFVAVDVCPRENTLNVLTGWMDDGRLPTYPTFLPSTDEQLPWAPLWAVIEAGGGRTEAFASQPNQTDLRKDLTRWAHLLREHAGEALAGRAPMPAISADELRALTQTPPSLTRQGETPALVVGQGQRRRVWRYAETHGQSMFKPEPTKDDEAFLKLGASFMRGALRRPARRGSTGRSWP